MALDLQNLYDDIRQHLGHEIVCVEYGEQAVSIECETCCMVLLDADKEELNENNVPRRN